MYYDYPCVGTWATTNKAGETTDDVSGVLEPKLLFCRKYVKPQCHTLLPDLQV